MWMIVRAPPSIQFKLMQHMLLDPAGKYKLRTYAGILTLLVCHVYCSSVSAAEVRATMVNRQICIDVVDATIAISEELWHSELLHSSCPAPPCPAPPASALSVLYQMLLVMLKCNQGSSSTQSYAAPLSLSVLYVPKGCAVHLLMSKCTCSKVRLKWIVVQVCRQAKHPLAAVVFWQAQQL